MDAERSVESDALGEERHVSAISVSIGNSKPLVCIFSKIAQLLPSLQKLLQLDDQLYFFPSHLLFGSYQHFNFTMQVISDQNFFVRG